MRPSIRLAVIPGDGIGPEVVDEGLKVLSAAIADEADVATTDVRPGREALARHRRDAAGRRPGRDAHAGRHPARRRRRPGRPERRAGARAAAAAALRARPLRQPAPRRGCTRASPRRWPTPGDDRLRRGPRGHRGPVRRQRRRGARRHPARDRHRGQRQHRVRRRAGRPGRVPPGRRPPAPHADPGAQAQRADPRRAPVAAHRRARSTPTSPRSPSATSTSTRRPSSWSPTRPGST